ncbi:MAG: helix-turn-helix domain-containing protein [Opitutaceae bacterium]
MPDLEDLNPALVRFGENVKAQRERRKLSQENLAGEADLDRSYVGGIERGERNPTILSALRIAAALGTSVAKLCEGIDG